MRHAVSCSQSAKVHMLKWTNITCTEHQAPTLQAPTWKNTHTNTNAACDLRRKEAENLRVPKSLANLLVAHVPGLRKGWPSCSRRARARGLQCGHQRNQQRHGGQETCRWHLAGCRALTATVRSRGWGDMISSRERPWPTQTHSPVAQLN